MAASLATVDDLYGSISGRAVQAEVRTASARTEELLIGQQVPWMDQAALKLQALVELPENWNSYGARRVTIPTADDALQLLARLYYLGLPAPAIVPTSSGGIQLEWEIRDVELELVLEPNGRMLAVFDDPEHQESWERDLPPRDLGPISDALRRMVRAGHAGDRG